MLKKLRNGIAVFLFAFLVLTISCSSVIADQPEYRWRMGAFFDDWHHLTQASYKFADALYDLTDGRIQVEVYPRMELGGGEEMMEGVQLGTIQLCEAALAWLATFDDSFYFANLPYLFETREVAYAFKDDFARQFIGEIGGTGIRLIGLLENGVRHVTTNQGPVRHPDDLKGQKIRTMPVPVHLDAFEQTGALATPLAFGELYMALQTGVLEGQENPYANIYDMSFYEVQDYMTLTGHFYDITGIYMNNDVYEELPADIQEAIYDAMEIAEKHHRRAVVKIESWLQEMFVEEDLFIEITELEREDVAIWKEAMSGTYDNFRDQIGPEFMEELLQVVRELHEQFYAGELDLEALYYPDEELLAKYEPGSLYPDKIAIWDHIPFEVPSF